MDVVTTSLYQTQKRETTMKPESRYMPVAEVAKLIRAELKTAYPDIKFSVRSKSYSMGSSISIHWTDGLSSKQINAITGKFAGEHGEWSGGDTIYMGHDSTYNGELVRFGSDHVFATRSHSAKALLEVAKIVCPRWGQPVLELLEADGDYPYFKDDYKRIGGGYQTMRDLVMEKVYEVDFTQDVAAQLEPDYVIEIKETPVAPAEILPAVIPPVVIPQPIIEAVIEVVDESTDEYQTPIEDYDQPDVNQFYPTPSNLVYKLIGPYNGPTSVLEPSAGNGSIADILKKHSRFEVSVCEISPDLRAILIGKGHKVIGTDFLTLQAPYRFGLVVMNPPFNRCADHVIKAWEDCLLPSGDIAAIIPKSALKKTTGSYTKLNQLIDLYGKVEEIGSAFSTAQRSTDAECVIIRLTKPAAKGFRPFADFTPNSDEPLDMGEAAQLPALRDMVKSIVAQYNASMKALRLTLESEHAYRRITPNDAWYTDEFKGESDNVRIEKTKTAFWELVFSRTKIGETITSGFRKQFNEERANLAQMEFSDVTIYEVLHRFMVNKKAIYEQCVMDVFKEATYYSRDNAIQSQQWATNKSWKVNSKIIMPRALNEYGWYLDYRQSIGDFLDDMDKVLTMFGSPNGVSTKNAIAEILKGVNDQNYWAEYDTPNFKFRVFKKGTLHLYFKDTEALDMINQFAAERNLFTLGSGK